MNVLIFGSRGWLGSRYAEHYTSRGADVWMSSVDVTYRSAVRPVIRSAQPDLVINAAGRTHSADIPNIDACIASETARRETLASNALGAATVALACAEAGCRLVHLGSGCIFDGPGVFDETSTPNPVSWYARTKAMGDEWVMAANPDALILRIRMPISAQPHPRNLITKLAHFEHVVDVTNSVTVVEDLLAYTDQLVAMRATGIVHAVHPQPVSYRLLMQWYRAYVDPAHVCTFIPEDALQMADGRSNAVLTSVRDLPPMADTATAVIRALRSYAGAQVAA